MILKETGSGAAVPGPEFHVCSQEGIMNGTERSEGGLQ
jgi:hypothetical protein